MDRDRRRRNRRGPEEPANTSGNPQDAQNRFPASVEVGELVIDFLIQNLRGPLLAALFTQAIHPLFSLYFSLLPPRAPHKLFLRCTTQVNLSVRFTLFALFRWLLPGQSATQSPPLMEAVGAAAVNHVLLHLLGRIPFKPLLGDLPQFHRLYLGFALASLWHEALSALHVWCSIRHDWLLPVLSGAVLGDPLAFLVWLAWRVDSRLERQIRFLGQGTLFHRLGLTNAHVWAFQDFHRRERITTLGSEFADYFVGGKINPRWLSVGRAEGYLKLHNHQLPYYTVSVIVVLDERVFALRLCVALASARWIMTAHVTITKSPSACRGWKGLGNTSTLVTNEATLRKVSTAELAVAP